MNITDLCWLAGLLEGEGCFHVRTQSPIKAGKTYGPYVYPSITLLMTDEDVVRRAHQVAGVGNVIGPNQKSPDRKPYWTWNVTRSSDAKVLMRLLLPLMGYRRAKRIREIIGSES